MKRISIAFVLLFSLAIFPLSAATNTSVPLGHRVYTVLDVAEIRGYIEQQMDVRPYSTSKVLDLLSQIEAQVQGSEKTEVLAIKSELTASHGTEDSGLDRLLSTGFLRSYDEETGLGASLGVSMATAQTFSAVTGEYDSRNSVLAFLKGDLGDAISFNMDFGLLLDKLNSNVFLPTDFTIGGEGFYLDMLHGGKQLADIPSAGFLSGLSLSPELAATYFGGNLNLRWGSIKRDWGPGLNNLLISGSARAFDGIDIQLNITPWLRYSVVNGSLGKFSLETLDGKPFFSDYFPDEKPFYRFDNNFSAHRVEFDFTKNFTFSVYESTVWQKRFELGYLNPLSIYMFQQNNLGDIDDVLAGIDFNYVLPKAARFYGSLAMTEMNKVGSLSTMLSAPRNIIAVQAGLVIPVPIGQFSSFTAQWTYLSPFFYAHYPIRELTGSVSTTDTSSTVTDSGKSYSVSNPGGGADPTMTVNREGVAGSEVITLKTNSEKEWLSSDGRTRIREENGTYYIYETTAETAYVNKGENLGYPLDPNSQEFLLQLDLGLEQGWTVQAQAKYQARSGQYGFSIEQYMDYFNVSSYGLKSFWDNTFKHTLSLQLKATKKFSSLPIELNASYQFVSVWERPYTTTTFDGLTTDFGSWTGPDVDHFLSVGAKVFF